MTHSLSRRLFAWLPLLAMCCPALSADRTNAPGPPPETARDFYNTGTHLLAAGKYDDAERMFSSALAAQEADVQPAALYNLGHARFDDGAAALKKDPAAQTARPRAEAAVVAGGRAIQEAQSALADNDLPKIIAAYRAGRGVHRELYDAQKAVRQALQTYGATLRKWQRAADDFKSAAELNPADTNAVRNAEIVERDIARLVDSLQQMQSMAGQIGKQRQQLGDLLNRMKGMVPQEDAPPGSAGDDDDEDLQPDALRGQTEGQTRAGNQMESPLSPEEAGDLLDSLSLDGSRRLPMNEGPAGQPRDHTRQPW